MKQYLTADYQSRLWEAIMNIETGSQAEAVVVFRDRSADYASVPLLWGLGAAWLCFTMMMYSPAYFENWQVYYAPLLAFALAYGFGSLPAVKRCCVRPATRDKRVEIMARAIFQKGGIQHTREKTGLLIYCSLLERRVFLLPDRGLEHALPPQLWRELGQAFTGIFTEKRPEEGLLAVLAKAASIFGRYLPPRAGDINELPDRLDVDL